MESTGSCIETLNLSLRIVTPDVYNYVMINYTDAEIMAFFGTDETGLTKEKLRHKGGLTTFNRSFLNFYIVHPDNNKTIGWCGYHTWHTDHNRAEIGYWMFDEGSKQKGYMTEVLEAVLSYGFNEMKLHRVEALVAEYNAPSLKLLNKYGFTYEGRLREHYYVDGVPEDSLMYSLLKHEFNLTKK